MAYGKQHPGQQTPTPKVTTKGGKLALHKSDNTGSDLLEAWLTAVHGPSWSTRGNGTYKSEVK